MTDTRTAETTSQPTGELPENREIPASARQDAGASVESSSEPQATERLSTADIARGGTATEPDAARTGNGASHASTNSGDTKTAPLFSDEAASSLRERWTDIQAGFVDEPRNAVEQADALVAEVMKRLAEGFSTERQALEQQWSSGGDASTEDLRMALRRYRSFFDRLLAI